MTSIADGSPIDSRNTKEISSMNYLYGAIQPTRLYIKQCPHCGLKYFGKTTNNKIEKYPGSGKIWVRHLRKHRVKPVHLWSSDWYYDTSITRFALKFSRINKIVESKKWANMKDENGLDGGDVGFLPGSEASKKRGKQISKTRNNINWKETVGKETAEYLSSLRTDPVWKENVGREALEKMKKTINSNEWKETIGKEKSKKISDAQNNDEWKNTVGKEKSRKVKETVNSYEWKETIGKEKSKRISKTKNSTEWKNTVGKERSEKMRMFYQNEKWLETTGKTISHKLSTIRNDEEWIEKNSKTCEYCNKKIQVSNYARWHGDKCKENRTL